MVEGLNLSTDGPVITATIDRGEGNRLSLAICRELTRLLQEPPEDAHVLRLEAAGDAFCLGRDRDGNLPGELRREVATLIDLNQALTRSDLVSVAAVQGDAAGFGVGLAALADVTIAAASAEFWFPEVEIDLAPTVVLSWLPGVIGRKRALYLTATGDRLTAAQAAHLGLVTRVVPDGEFTGAVDQTVKQLTGFNRRVHREIKTFLTQTEGLTDTQAYTLATDRLILGSMARRRG